MTIEWFGSKGMQRDRKKIQIRGQMMNGQTEKMTGWQDKHGAKNTTT